TTGRCATTASGVATRCSVSPRWPSCPPGFLPLRRRRLLGFRRTPSLEGGLPLLWLSLASRASRSCTRASSTATCSRNAGSSLSCARSAAFSAANAAIWASGVMCLCYTYSASLPDLLRDGVIRHEHDRVTTSAIWPAPDLTATVYLRRKEAKKRKHI